MTEFAAWLRLLRTPGVGPDVAVRLLKSFGSPEAVFDASAAALHSALGNDRLSPALQTEIPELAPLTAACEAWLAADPERHGWMSLGDAAYPAALLETADPPMLLFTQGRTELLGRPSLAIVGSRNATPQGVENAKAFAAHLSRQSLTIVSGLALGIDAAAHAGALEGDGSTIAVVGTGLDLVYPRRNLALAHRIAKEGLMLSEFPIGTPSLPVNFPRRNRIIAGLSRGTLVVEAAAQSGSLITARLAAEAGREVFAIPGSIHSPQSRGCHALIKQGAKLVETADDILGELNLARTALTAATTAAAPAENDALLERLGHDPTTLDALVARTGWPAQRLSARLLELELEGRVARLPGGLYQRLAVT